MSPYTDTRASLVTQGLPLVHKVARRVARRVPAHVDFGDLWGAGAEGLLRAVAAFDPTRSERFEPYAEARIRGAILDELRATDVMTQHGRRRLAEVRRRSRELESTLGRQPSVEEIAEALGITVDAYGQLLGAASVATQMVAGAESDLETIANGSPDPASLYAQAEERHRLAAAIEKLPKRMQEVLALYYQEECTQAEIGVVLGVTESRVCQILAEAAGRLRFALGGPRGGTPTARCHVRSARVR